MGLRSEQPSFTDIEYGNRRRISRRERFFYTSDATTPWREWVAVIEPFYYEGKKGRKPKPLETLLRSICCRRGSRCLARVKRLKCNAAPV